MQDLFFFVVGLAVCSAPFFGLAGLVAFLRNAKDTEARARIDLLEAEFVSLRKQADQLTAHGAQLSSQTLYLKNELEKRTLSAPQLAATSSAVVVATQAPVTEPVAVTQREAVAVTESVAVTEAVTEAVPPAPSTPPRPSLPESDPQSEGEGEGEGWERWIGVRGAAVLGACVLVIAALYFLRFSVEHGWIGPLARVIMGLMASTAYVVLSEWPLRRRYLDIPEGSTVPLGATLPNWLAGAGIAILYASSWAASGLYHLVPNFLSGIAMVAITAACAALAVHRDALSIAMLGLFGGFLTPIALSTGEDKPVSLFTYLLVLDAALLFLAQKKKWPSLALFAMAFTGIYQLMWIFGRMSETTTWIGIVVTVIFAALFTAVPMLLGRPKEEDENEALTSLIVRVGAVLLPFALTLSFAVQHSAQVGFGATLALLLTLTMGTFIVASRDKLGWLLPAAASATAGIVLVFGGTHFSEDAFSWQFPLLTLLPTLLHFALFEAQQALGSADSPLAKLFANVSGLSLSSLILSVSSTVWLAFPLTTTTAHDVPFSIGVALASLLSLRVAIKERWFIVVLPIALLQALCWALITTAGTQANGRGAVMSLVMVACALVYQAVAMWAHTEHGETRHPSAWSWALEASAGGTALISLLALLACSDLRLHHAWLFAFETIVFALLTILPAARVASREHPGAATALIGLFVTGIVVMTNEMSQLPEVHFESMRWLRFGTSTAAMLLFAVLPALMPRLRETRWAWRTAALSPVVFFSPLHHAWTWAFGTTFVGLLPVLLALLMLGLVLAARRNNEDDSGVRLSAIVWLAGAAMLFVTFAIPLQLDRSWITIGWALEAMALLALHRRLDHAGLKWVAVALFAAVCSRLLLNPYVLGYYDRGEIRIFNWLSYTYLVPAAALAIGAWLLASVEKDRRREWERSILPDNIASPVSGALVAASLVVLFAWLNLTIFDWYASGPYLTIPYDRMPARDLTISIAWAVYGLFVLSLGMWKDSTALRMTSLLIILITAGKVFLYDLSNLEDLYRVAALVGLAFSLLSISLAYQRFVFRKNKAASAANAAKESA